MTRGVELTQRQVRALCEGAKKAGCIAVVQIGKAVVKLVPEEHAIPEKPNGHVDPDNSASSAYEKWKAGRDAREP